MEKVVADDGVLLRPDAQRGVTLGDAFDHDVDREACPGSDLGGGECGDGAGEGLALGAGGLGAAGEHIEQFGVFGEHGVVEDTGDGLQVLAHDGQGGPHDFFVGRGQHDFLHENAGGITGSPRASGGPFWNEKSGLVAGDQVGDADPGSGERCEGGREATVGGALDSGVE
ncbi:hypothetical protein GCM10009608_59330 [Pseudonocardia alaniniphila]